MVSNFRQIFGLKIPHFRANWLRTFMLSFLAATFAATIVAAANSAAKSATIVKSPSALARLLGNSGITLQWIGWADRGSVDTRWQGRTLYIEAEQRDADTGARVHVDGRVVSIDQNSFTLRGKIEIVGSPDAERRCRSEGDWRFAVTQNRKYWRLRQFEWCDGLTDYIDIYF